MNREQRSRVQSAVTEQMDIEPRPDGTFLVKGEYEVDPQALSCSCPDFRFRSMRCKHLIRVRLELLWGNIEPDTDDEAGRPVDVPPRPDVLETDFDGVPETLKEYDQWVCWKQQVHENKDGTKRWTKVPIDVEGGGFASSTDPETWTSYEQAKEYAQREWTDADGIGFVVSGDDDFIGIDFDDVRDPETGTLSRTAAKLIGESGSYAEVSPSGTGVRVFVRGEKKSDGNQAEIPGVGEDPHVEMYDHGRYLTVTGHHVDGTPDDVVLDQETVDRFDALCDGRLSFDGGTTVMSSSLDEF